MMLGRLVFLGAIVTAAAVCVPLLHQRNPEALGSILRSFSSADDIPYSGTPAAPVRGAPTPKTETGRKVRLSADGRGHYIAEFRLNGRAVEALVDTGATRVAINRSTARRIGLKIARSDFRYEVGTANGTARAAAATIESLRIGGIHVQDVEAMVLEDRALGVTLVGMSFLNRLSRFQVEDGSLLLEQ